MTEVRAMTLEELMVERDNVARASRPEKRTEKVRLASDAQVNFIVNLIAEKCDGDPADVDRSDLESLTIDDASDTITHLLNGVKAHRANAKSNGVTIPSGPPATDKQIAFVKRLIDQKGATDIDVDSLTKSSASDAIEDLLARGNATTKSNTTSSAFLSVDDYPEIVPSRYAVTGDDGTTDFYVAQHGKNKWAGTLFIKLHVSGRDDQNLRGANAKTIAEKIMSDGPRNAAIRYGHELGHCSRCGIELTNNDSIEAGIGPVCASKVGW